MPGEPIWIIFSMSRSFSKLFVTGARTKKNFFSLG
jgi:hypothetical protein